MRRAERVVFALGALGEAGEPARLAQRADAVAPAGQDLVRIGLVADVPDQPVARRVEDVVERDRQLDHAEAGAEMAAGDRDRGDRLAGAVRRRAGGGRIPGSRRSRRATVDAVEERGRVGQFIGPRRNRRHPRTRSPRGNANGLPASQTVKAGLSQATDAAGLEAVEPGRHRRPTRCSVLNVERLGAFRLAAGAEPDLLDPRLGLASAGRSQCFFRASPRS